MTNPPHVFAMFASNEGCLKRKWLKATSVNKKVAEWGDISAFLEKYFISFSLGAKE